MWQPGTPPCDAADPTAADPKRVSRKVSRLSNGVNISCQGSKSEQKNKKWMQSKTWKKTRATRHLAIYWPQMTHNYRELSTLCRARSICAFSYGAALSI